MDSLVQQQIHHDIQPQEIATAFKTLVIKHRRLQITRAGDENHNETKKGEALVLISLKIIHHLHIKTQEIHKE